MRLLLFSLALPLICVAMALHSSAIADEPAESVRSQLQKYVATFNDRDAKAVAEFWAEDAVSVQEETGERTEGRAALLKDFAEFFTNYPKAQMAGDVRHIRMVGDDVAIVEGQATLATGEGEPIRAGFTAVIKKQGDKWLIASSHERDLPVPASAGDALQQLQWMVGTWKDDTEGVSVMTTVRWSPGESFLIRSFQATFADGDGFSGTQIFGWDAGTKLIRTWTFNSDGSFGDGVVTQSGNDWKIKMNQVQVDGRLTSGTIVMSLVNPNTLEVQKIAESIDGQPVPASPPIVVKRVVAKVASESDATEGAE